MGHRGRGLSWPATQILPLFIITKFVSCSSDYDGVPIEIKSWDTGRTPLAHMVDVTNEFGLKVLAEHNFLNDNNIAFSPYGLVGILVALYEGVEGESSYQLQRGMQLPWNRNVMRIGFRDIHRTLKTYFVPEEGFLAGLALNNENVIFNENFKNILRFYGFDLDNEQLPTLPPPAPGNNTNESTTSTSLPERTSTSTDNMNTQSMTSSSTPAMPLEQTTNPNAETISIREEEETTVIPSLAANSESTTTMLTTNNVEVVSQINTQSVETMPITLATTTMASEETTMLSAPEVSQMNNQEVETVPISVVTTSITSEEVSMSEDTTQAVTSAAPSTTEETSPTSVATANTTATVNNVETTLSAITPEIIATSQAIQEETTFTMNNEVSNPEITTNSERTPETDSSIMTTAVVQTVEESSTTATETLESLERKKRSVVDFVFADPPYVDDYLIHRTYDVPVKTNHDGEKMFLVNGLRNVQVSYMHYDTVLEHSFLPHLEATALRLPLDSDRYYLLVVLPNRGGPVELGRLLARMARGSDLRDVYEALRPRRVRAIVPSFTVKGHITLTTDLQKLGIRDVFEPRQRDFEPMTKQPGVYVRSIEQAVSVAIRKYRPDEHKNRYVNNRQPVHFSATYPFLYFVMDSSIHVALMAGKMVDPLNNRIL